MLPQDWVQPQQDDSDDGASDEDHVTRMATNALFSIYCEIYLL